MERPLVSVIVTTRNNHDTLEACLQSITAQTYTPLELIVVDNDSTDDTKAIARCYTQIVLNRPPERSVQRNFGVARAHGTYVAIIDSDMELEPEVIAASVAVMQGNEKASGVIIPEESFGQGFWAQCKRLERSFYVGVDWIEAARFFSRQTYMSAGGYDETMVSGEDWDLSRRIAEAGTLERVTPFIHHNEGRLQLWTTLKKKAYYARQARNYFAKNKVGAKLTAQAGPLQRYKLFFTQPRKLFSNPFTAMGMLFMKTCEFAFGGVGYLFGSRSASHE
ncbi:MAG TPA: glycosyltransferase family A protein [Patescibacteria group bacterium]|nr:glycosyltransferase family A protein [Patescibacteria group bacterium]